MGTIADIFTAGGDGFFCDLSDTSKVGPGQVLEGACFADDVISLMGT